MLNLLEHRSELSPEVFWASERATTDRKQFLKSWHTVPRGNESVPGKESKETRRRPGSGAAASVGANGFAGSSEWTTPDIWSRESQPVTGQPAGASSEDTGRRRVDAVAEAEAEDGVCGRPTFNKEAGEGTPIKHKAPVT